MVIWAFETPESIVFGRAASARNGEGKASSKNGNAMELIYPHDNFAFQIIVIVSCGVG